LFPVFQSCTFTFSDLFDIDKQILFGIVFFVGLLFYFVEPSFPPVYKNAQYNTPKQMAITKTNKLQKKEKTRRKCSARMISRLRNAKIA
jgi:hypothetical protein